MEEVEIVRQLEENKQSVKSAHHRIDSLEVMQKEIRDLALSVNTLAGSVKSLCIDVAAMSCRVRDIEAKPGKRLDQMIGYILSALVGGLMTMILNNLLK